MPLHERDRWPALAQHDRHRLVVHRIGLGIAVDADAVFAVAVACAHAFEHALDVLRAALLLQILDDAVHFLIGDESTMHA